MILSHATRAKLIARSAVVVGLLLSGCWGYGHVGPGYGGHANHNGGHHDQGHGRGHGNGTGHGRGNGHH